MAKKNLFKVIFMSQGQVYEIYARSVGHGKMFGLSEADLSRQYFQYVANYKIAIVVFNLVPYIALVLMT